MPLGWLLKLIFLLASLANPLWLVAIVPLLLRWQGGTGAMATCVGALLVALSILSRAVGLITGSSETTAIIMWVAGNGLFLWGYFKDRKALLTTRLLPYMAGMDVLAAVLLFLL